MAYAGAKFTIRVSTVCVCLIVYVLMYVHYDYALSVQLLEAMGGKSGVVECAFVQSDLTEANYFATPLLLGKGGVEKNLGMGTLSAFEQEKMKEVGA